MENEGKEEERKRMAEAIREAWGGAKTEKTDR